LENLLEALLPKAPPWLLVPGAVILIFLLAWPSLHEIWTILIPSYRVYAREKRRLDLLKLYYELEAIKKDHQLVEVPPAQSEALNALLLAIDRRPPKVEVIGISSSQKLLFGAFGGALMSLISVLPLLESGPDLTLLTGGAIIGLVLRMAIMSGLGAVTAWMTKCKSSSDAIIRGAAIPLLIVLVLGAVEVSRPPLVAYPRA
jgi:hypothetical protein